MTYRATAQPSVDISVSNNQSSVSFPLAWGIPVPWHVPLEREHNSCSNPPRRWI